MPEKRKVTSHLERFNWIGGGLSGAAAVVTVLLTMWGDAKSDREVSHNLSVTGATVQQTGAVIIQGNGNTVVSPISGVDSKVGAGRFVRVDVREYKVDLKAIPRHEVRFPQVSGGISADILARTNHLLKRTALTEYERYSGMDDVKVSYVVGLTEFNLLGVSFEIYASGDRAAHPLSSTSATTIDLETGSPLMLKDYFIPGYVGKLNAIVQSKLIANDSYFPCETLHGATKAVSVVSSALEQITGHSANACFDSVADDTQYFLTDTSLVIVFPKYAAGPGVAGDIEVPISFGEIRGLMRPDGPLSRFL